MISERFVLLNLTYNSHNEIHKNMIMKFKSSLRMSSGCCILLALWLYLKMIEKWYWVWHASDITPTCSKDKEICKNVMSIQALHWSTLLGRILFMMQGDIFPYIIMLPREEILDSFAIWHEKISQKKPFKVFEYLWIVHDTFCVYFTTTLDKKGCKWF